MKNTVSFLSIGVLAAATALAGCSGNDGKVSVQPSDAPLSDSASDALFTLTLEESGQTDGYAVASLKVKVTPEGKKAIDVVCAVNDTNKNQSLDKGESLACREGANNDLGRDLAGKETKVELFATIDGAEERVGDGKWTPK